MEHPLKRMLVIIAAAALLSACSSGGGGGGGGNPPASNKQVSVSGVASQSSGPSGVSASSVTKQATAAILAGAEVTILSYDKDGVMQDTVKAVTGPNGAFNAPVTALGGGGTISVKVQAPNAIIYEKNFPYTTAEELSAGLQIDAILDPVAIKVVTTNNADFDKAAIGSNMVSIAVVKDSNGVKRIMSNSQISAAKAAGGEVTWQLDVAKSVLAAAGTTELTVKAQNYNPASPDDMTRFPATNTDTGDRLISASFDFIDIKDQDGEPLKITKAAAKSARKSAAVAYAVKKMIPDCNLILKDENTTKPGVQIGFYFMSNGKWKKLGESTLYDDVGTATTNPVLHVLGTCAGNSLPYAVLTDADVSSDIDFDLKWFNFDYVAFGDLKTDCAEGAFNLTKADGSSAGLGGVNINLFGLKQGTPAANVPGFQSAYGYTKSDGKYKIDFTYQSTTLTNPTATISYTDPVNWDQSSKNVTLTTKNANGCYEIAPITILEPACSVTGKLLKSDGSAAANRNVNAYRTSTYGGNLWATTDSGGNYSLQVTCSTDYTLNADGMSKAFNVNSTVGSDESADNGAQATMKDITKVNNAPTAYIYTDNSSVALGNGVNLNGYGYDPDNDPLTYAWSSTCGGFTAPGATASAATSTNQSAKWTAPAAAPGSNLCTLSLTVSDGSKTGTTISDIYVSASGNRPPVISYLYAPTSMTAGRNANLLVQAYDANQGDTLSYSWSSTCGTLTGATSTNPGFTAPQTAGSCQVTVQVSDGTTPVSKTATITVNPNQAPTITNINVPAAVALGGTAALSASVYDINGDNLDWSWSVVSGGGTLGSGCSGSGTGSVSSSCSYTAPGTQANVALRFTVSDGVNPAVTQDKTLLVTSATGVTDIIVQ